MNIPIVYEDQWLLVADKPSGLLVIPAPDSAPRTLTSIFNDDLLKYKKPYRLHPCHRLDRDTSGLIVYAKGPSVQKKMMAEFRDRRVKKIYMLFALGRLDKRSGDITSPVEGKPAKTSYRVVGCGKYFDVVEAMPLTGRTNQIRIHFKKIGHPVFGDTKFAFRRDFPVRVKRLCLHARDLEFRHPVTGKMVAFHSDIPTDMKKYLENN